jgi:hypothetical protein
MKKITAILLMALMVLSLRVVTRPVRIIMVQKEVLNQQA